MKTTEPLLLVTINHSAGVAATGDGVIPELLDFAYGARRKKPACLDLLVSGDAEMEKMNRRHLGHEGTTDVLSFADGEEEDGRLRLGDVAINAEMAARVAAERGGAFEHELAFYALHGLFHLLGMEDGDDRERTAMLKAQEKAMREFGLEPGEML